MLHASRKRWMVSSKENEKEDKSNKIWMKGPPIIVRRETKHSYNVILCMLMISSIFIKWNLLTTLDIVHDSDPITLITSFKMRQNRCHLFIECPEICLYTVQYWILFIHWTLNIKHQLSWIFYFRDSLNLENEINYSQW